MKSLVVSCHYSGVLRNEEEDHIFIVGEKGVLLLDGNNFFPSI